MLFQKRPFPEALLWASPVLVAGRPAVGATRSGSHRAHCLPSVGPQTAATADWAQPGTPPMAKLINSPRHLELGLGDSGRVGWALAEGKSIWTQGGRW